MPCSFYYSQTSHKRPTKMLSRCGCLREGVSFNHKQNCGILERLRFSFIEEVVTQGGLTGPNDEYLCSQILLSAMHLRDCRKIMRNCCSQVPTSTVADQHHTCDVNTMVCSCVEQPNSNIVAVIELGWINIMRSLPVTKMKNIYTGLSETFRVCCYIVGCHFAIFY